MIRGFEKISYHNFAAEVVKDKKMYDEYILPKRNTKYSAGYDFYLINDIVLNPKAIVKIPTGVKAYMKPDEFLMIVVRSSIGCKKNLRLMNQVGIIDSDYYNNTNNEGQIFVFLQNNSEETVILKKGEKFVQGLFLKYLMVDEDEVNETRLGGFGSTNKEEIK